MAIWQRHKIQQPITDRAPAEKSMLPWLQREGYAFLQQTYRVVNWAVKYLGKLGVDLNDVPGTAENKLIAGTGMTITKIGADGSRQLLFSANVPPPVTPPDPTQPPGTTPTPGALLYPGLSPDSKLRAPCKGMLPHGEGVGFGTNWISIGNGMWQRSSLGQLNYSPADTAVVPASDGDRVFAWSSTPFGPDEPQAYGIYDVLDCGFHMVQAPLAPPGVLYGVSSQAIIRRSADASTPANLCHNMVVPIVGATGVEHNGDYFTLTTADPIVVDTTGLTFSIASSYFPADRYLLLTAAMVSTTATVPFEAVGTATNMEVLFTGDNFGVTAAELGVDRFPAGQVTFFLSAKCDAIPTDGLNTIRATLFKYAGGSSTTICDGYTSPIWSTGLVTYKVVCDVAADVALAPTDILYFAPYFKTTSASQQICRLETGSPWETKIQTTFQLGRSSSMHDDLYGRNTIHNHYGVGACTTVSGVIPVPTQRKMVVTVSGATTLTEMGTAGLEDGVEVELVFLQGCKIVNGATAATGNAPFVLGSIDGSPADIDWTLPVPQDLGRIGVTYYKTGLPASPCFLLTWGPTI